MSETVKCRQGNKENMQVYSIQDIDGIWSDSLVNQLIPVICPPGNFAKLPDIEFENCLSFSPLLSIEVIRKIRTLVLLDKSINVSFYGIYLFFSFTKL